MNKFIDNLAKPVSNLPLFAAHVTPVLLYCNILLNTFHNTSLLTVSMNDLAGIRLLEYVFATIPLAGLIIASRLIDFCIDKGLASLDIPFFGRPSEDDISKSMASNYILIVITALLDFTYCKNSLTIRFLTEALHGDGSIVAAILYRCALAFFGILTILWISSYLAHKRA